MSELVHLWKVAAGEKGYLFDEFIRDGYVSIGFDLTVPIGNLGDAKAIREFLSPIHPAPATLNSFVDQVFDFLHGIKAEDWVITNDPRNRVYRLGRVIGSPEFRAGATPHKYYRQIEWKPEAIPFEKVSDRTRVSVDRPPTVFPIKGTIDYSPFNIESRFWRYKYNRRIFWPSDVIEAFSSADNSPPEAGRDYMWHVAIDPNDRQGKPLKRVFEHMSGGPYDRSTFTTAQIRPCFENTGFQVFRRADDPATPPEYSSSLNLILYGPPGTGKTFTTIEKAVSICDGQNFLDEREDLVERYKALETDGRITFVSFHQSYSYEDFVEGIRPVPADGNISYEVVPGIFRRMCNAALSNSEIDDQILNSVLKEVDRSGKDGKKVLTDRQAAGVLTRRDATSDINYTNENGKTYALSGQRFRELWAKRSGIKRVTDINKITGTDLSNLNSYYWALIKFAEEIALDVGTSSSDPYVLIIDEINRANISKVFGELITLIEEDKRLGEVNELTATLPYSGEKFGVPSNLYIVGTMNTADRSIALLDIALRRRFTFEEIAPNSKILSEGVDGVNLKNLLTTINQRIEFLIDRDHCIGHAYFLKVESLDMLLDVFRNKIIPLLQEYCFDDWGRIVKVLATGNDNDGPTSHFVEKLKPPRIPGIDQDEFGQRYAVTASKHWKAEHFQAIYSAI